MRVDGTRRFNENQGFRLRQQRAGQYQPLPLPAGKTPPPLGHLGIEARLEPVEDIQCAGSLECLEDSPVTGAAMRIQRAPQATGEHLGIRLTHDNPAPDLIERNLVQGGSTPPNDGVPQHCVIEAAQPGREIGGDRRIGGDQRGQSARLQADTGQRIHKRRGARRSGGSGDIGNACLHGQHVDDLPCSDQRPDRVRNAVGSAPDGGHQENGITEQGDQLAGLDVTVQHQRCAYPGEHHAERTRDEDLRRLQCCQRAGNPDAGVACFSGPLTVAVDEDVLPADAAQNAQSRDRIGTHRGHFAGCIALVALPGLQRPDHEQEQCTARRNTCQHDGGERNRTQGDEPAHNQPGHQRTGEAGADVENLAEPRCIGRGRGHHLAGGELLRQRVSRAGDVVPHQPDRLERCLHPVADGRTVRQHSGERLPHGERNQDPDPPEQRLLAAADDPLVNGAPQRKRNHSLRHHEERFKHDGGSQCAFLAGGQPEQVAGRRPEVRRTRVGVGVRAHEDQS